MKNVKDTTNNTYILVESVQSTKTPGSQYNQVLQKYIKYKNKYMALKKLLS